MLGCSIQNMCAITTHIEVRKRTKIRHAALSQQVTTRHQQTDVHESITKQKRDNINDP